MCGAGMRPASIDGNRLAVDHSGNRRAEVEDGVSDILGHADAADG